MNRNVLVCAIVLSTGLAGWSEEKTAPMPAGLEKQAGAIKPVDAELRWQQIPWVMDLLN